MPDTMTNQHKKALAEGRRQGAIARRYLEALAARPKRGRKRTPESVQKQLDNVVARLAEETDRLKLLELMQQEIDLTAELEQMERATDIAEIEAEFVRIAAGYADRKGITYRAFREVGVPAATLHRAGIKR